MLWEVDWALGGGWGAAGLEIDAVQEVKGLHLFPGRV